MVSCLGFERSKYTDLWVDKYSPRTLDELAVHKNKVAFVLFFLFALNSSWFTYAYPFFFFNVIFRLNKLNCGLRKVWISQRYCLFFL